ncbi:MAG TPA: ATP-binding protein [Polyangiales bacterium]|jgi:hypothetical protein|nr:ATP-binding protein [Polyangiales bacterium]
MALTFKKATRTQAKARVALIGPSGSGKTYSALLMAITIAGDKRVALIDTEHGAASKYADMTDPRSGLQLDFDVLELDSFAPDTYVDAIEAAQKAGYGVLVIDSLSHAWSGKDGALEQVDKAAKKSQSGNSFTAWRDVTPKHNRLVEAMAACDMHLIVTMRSKMEYVLEQIEVQRNGRTTTITQPRKVGLAPIQREGLEYEFDVVGDIDIEHNWVISKTRCPEFDGAVIERPGVKFAETYAAWLQTGAPAAPRQALPPPKPEPAVRRTVSIATFSKYVKWDGAPQWEGKPIDKAPLDTLTLYRDAVSGIVEREQRPDHKASWQRHLKVVDEAMARLEPQLERDPGDDPGDANEEPGNADPATDSATAA